jgi:hypothetical protein
VVEGMRGLFIGISLGCYLMGFYKNSRRSDCAN